MTLLAAPDQKTTPGYNIVKPDSHLVAVTGKTGLFSFAAHQHAIMANDWKAELEFSPQQFTQSSIHVTIPVSSLVIDSAEARKQAELGSSPGEDDVRKIQQRMLSTEILDAKKYPTIEFRSTSIEVVSGEELKVTGALSLHGITRNITVPVHYKKYKTPGYGFYAEFTIRQTEFGLKPESVAGGTVKVKDAVKISVQLSVVPAQ